MRADIPPLPQYAFMAWCSVKEKHRDYFIFIFTFKNKLFSTMVAQIVDGRTLF
jgi:hypothetical protein